jgi:hypothetical protein
LLYAVAGARGARFLFFGGGGQRLDP